MGTSDDVADDVSATLERQGLIWNDPPGVRCVVDHGLRPADLGPAPEHGSRRVFTLKRRALPGSTCDDRLGTEGAVLCSGIRSRRDRGEPLSRVLLEVCLGIGAAARS